MEKKSLIIFDCDGTLIDSEAANNLAVSQAISELGCGDDYDVRSCLKKFRGKSLIDIVNIVSREIGVMLDKDVFVNLINQKAAESYQTIAAVENAKEVLDNLNIKKCVASNGNRECVIRCLEHTGMYDVFGEQRIFTQSQVPFPKPAPDLFLYAAQKCDVDPLKSIVIEDSETGIIAAKKAKMVAVGFTGTAINVDRREEKLKKAGADYIISDLNEILMLVV